MKRNVYYFQNETCLVLAKGSVLKVIPGWQHTCIMIGPDAQVRFLSQARLGGWSVTLLELSDKACTELILFKLSAYCPQEAQLD